MADYKKCVPENVPGRFFVDDTCIDCDTCRQIAPTVYGDTGNYAYVMHQPGTPMENRQALQALLSCPVGAIGAETNGEIREAMNDFPLCIEGDVYYCGFNSEKSYGGNSYFVRHPLGNWLIDSPRYVNHLVGQFERMGGIRTIFLTHRDDVADADRYARQFGSERIIHEADRRSQPGAERIIRGTDPVSFGEDFLVIPTPGHTRGHCVLLYRNRYLFTGDHLWWNRDQQHLGASRSYCWHSWEEQKHSLRRLLDYPFEWVLPGHGQRIHLLAEAMHEALMMLVQRVAA